jgi:hypothetical protein
MKVHTVTQGTPEWLALRAGIPTASCFDQILTPKGKVSTQAERYMHQLLAERIMGHPVEQVVTSWMDRGTQLEAEAVNYYEGIREVDTTRIGFLTNDAGTIGASPDRFVGEDGLLEIKVPKEHTHVAYLLGSAVSDVYKPQVQGQLWISGRQWCDSMSYHPEMPPALVRTMRDDAYIAALTAGVETFAEELDRMAAKLRERGWIK